MKAILPILISITLILLSTNSYGDEETNLPNKQFSPEVLDLFAKRYTKCNEGRSSYFCEGPERIQFSIDNEKAIENCLDYKEGIVERCDTDEELTFVIELEEEIDACRSLAPHIKGYWTEFCPNGVGVVLLSYNQQSVKDCLILTKSHDVSQSICLEPHLLTAIDLIGLDNVEQCLLDNSFETDKCSIDTLQMPNSLSSWMKNRRTRIFNGAKRSIDSLVTNIQETISDAWEAAR